MVVCCMLDDNFKSKFLCQKLSDIPNRVKKEILKQIKTNPEYLKELVHEKQVVDVKRDLQLLISASVINWKIINFLPAIQFEKQIALQAFTHFYYKDLERIYIENHEQKHSLFSDEDWILELSTSHRTVYCILSRLLPLIGDSAKRNKQIVRNIFKSYCAPYILQCFDVSIRSDRELILELLQYSESVLYYVDNKLLNDWKLVRIAVKSSYSYWIVGRVSNIKIAKYWIEKCPRDYKNCSHTMKCNREIALIALKKRAIILSDIPSQAINKEILFEALKIHSTSLQWAPENLLADKSTILEAIKYSPSNLQFADVSLKSDREFILQLIEIDANIIRFVSDSLKDDIEIAQRVVSRNGCLLNCFSLNIKKNVNVVRKALESDGIALQYIYPYFDNQREIILTAVRQNGCALRYVENYLKMDREIVIEALNNGCPIAYVDPEFRKEKDIILIALKNDSRVLKWLDWNEKEFVDASKKINSYWIINK